jgi:hypothetical protein
VTQSKSRNTDGSIMAEWDRQTPQNISSMDHYERLFEEAGGSTLSKLENFAKHTRRQALSKFLARSEIYKQILNVHGSILDLGVNAGQSLFTWAQISAILEPINYTRQIIGFDTFAGIPSVVDVDRSGSSPSDHVVVGGFEYSDFASLQKAVQAYDSNRFLSHIPKIQLVKGDITKTLPDFINNNRHLVVSLLHIDVDVYEPTKVALENVIPLMPKGAIIVFDEVNQIGYPGETQAIKDTVGLNKLRLQRFHWETGISFAVIE